MAQKVFLIADTHFGHQGMCEFLREDGTKVRPWSDAHEMNKALVEHWNQVVAPTDKVYVLGDVCMNNHSLGNVHLLHGTKVLIKGNHDQCKPSRYLQFFKDIRAYWQLGGCVLSHVPIHPESLSRWKANIHGHTHYKRVLDAKGKPDPRYFCVSVEQINYTPILLETVLRLIDEERAHYGLGEFTRVRSESRPD